MNSSNWLDHVEHNMGKNVRAQFERAISRNTTNLFVENVLTHDAQIMRPDEYYYGLSNKMNTEGRNQDDAEQATIDLIDGKSVDWSRYQFVTNPLVPVEVTDDLYRKPSMRVACGPHYIFTFEFDKKDTSFFNQQLGWFRYTNHDTNCPIGELHQALSGYTDFVGIVACYSGNKSFHIHIVFDPNLARVAYHLDSDADVDLRAGFITHWQLLKEEVLRILNPTVNGVTVEPDAQLRFPEWYRRLPGGSRLIAPRKDKPNWTHAFGIPFGVSVPQVIMWQKFRKQSGKDSTALFFRPCPFRAVKAAAAKKRNARAVSFAKSHDGFSADEFAFIEEQLRDHYPAGTYPEFAHLSKENTGWVARFRNSASDANPSSIMKEDHSAVLLMGKSADTIIAKPLPQRQPLRAMMRLWKDQYHRMLKADEVGETFDDEALCLVDEEDELELVLDPKHAPGDTELERRFVATATDMDAAAKATRAFFRHALATNQCILVKGPEGGGKTTALTKQHDRIVRWLDNRRKPTLTMHAFTDYVGAEEKCDAFNDAERARRKRRGPARGRDRNYVGVVLPSFSQIYGQACKRLNFSEFTSVTAAQLGCKSVWDAISTYQSEVLDYFRDAHLQMWSRIGSDTPVFFTVHAVAHTWRTFTPTRTMWARDFWVYGGDPFDWRARKDTELGVLAHDEVRHTDLIDIERAEIVEWVGEMMDAEAAIWFDRSGTVALAARYQAYERFVQKKGHPVVRGQTHTMSFDKARKLIAGGMLDWSEMTLSAEGAYPEINVDKLLYSAPVVDGHRWMVRAKYWWRDHRTPTGRVAKSKLRIAERVIILTTEELPAAVLRVADPVCWTTFSLETPHLGRDVVDVELDRSVTSAKVCKTVTKHRDRLGSQIVVISNRVKVLPNTQSPVSARGSNLYIGKDILQTMMFLAPAVHEEMLVLNAYTGRDDCVVLAHMDMFNQTVGRNMGYRRKGNAKHYLLVNTRLFDFLIDKGAFAYARYDIVVHLTKKQRIRVKAAA